MILVILFLTLVGKNHVTGIKNKGTDNLREFYSAIFHCSSCSCFGGMSSTVLQTGWPARTEHSPHYFEIVMLSLSQGGYW
jgi:hypothetical protein